MMYVICMIILSEFADRLSYKAYSYMGGANWYVISEGKQC